MCLNYSPKVFELCFIKCKISVKMASSSFRIMSALVCFIWVLCIQHWMNTVRTSKNWFYTFWVVPYGAWSCVGQSTFWWVLSILYFPIKFSLNEWVFNNAWYPGGGAQEHIVSSPWYVMAWQSDDIWGVDKHKLHCQRNGQWNSCTETQYNIFQCKLLICLFL